jgi:hypothetical protein
VSPVATGLVIALAESTGTNGIDLSPIINVGAFGVLSLLLLGFSLTVYKREVKRADTAELALQALQAKVIELYVPAVVEATKVVGEFVTEARRDRR